MKEMNNNQLPPELEALDARLAALGAAERAAAPASLEAEIFAATSGFGAAEAPAPKPQPSGVIGRLSLRRLDWPMRAAAVIAVMIGGWAVFNGANGPKPAGPTFNPDEMFDYVFGRPGTAEQIQHLLGDAANLDALIGGEDLGEPDVGDKESL
ncbi:MAG TPA: hypothetical protein VFF65_04255 [Phycisphaerales bacterium]|nr:hypothetical protein [Phycisphaerales bacterium]